MLSGKKAPVTINTARNTQAQLDALYARRSAIDDLIASLEAYDRYRAGTPTNSGQQRKSA
jgi:hypothetical protein